MNRQQASCIGHRQTRLVITGALLLGVWAFSATAWAQSSRNTSSRSGSGAGAGSWTQSNSAYSTGSLGGTSSISGSRSGSGGATSSSSMSSQLEQAASNTQFSRSSRGAENFVGADSSDSRNILGYENSAQRTSRNGRNTRSTTRSAYSNTNRNANRNFNSYGNSGSYGYGTQSNRARYGQTTVDLQPTLSLGFDYAGPVVPNLTTKLVSRLKTSAVATAALPVQVQVLDGTATLTGTVASDHERALAEQLLALEPGVRRVDNQLSVAPPDPK